MLLYMSNAAFHLAGDGKVHAYEMYTCIDTVHVCPCCITKYGSA